MTDATMMETSADDNRSSGDAAGGIAAGFRRLMDRIREFRTTMRAERDFDRIHDALNGLNKRQLEMLGLNREDVFTFAELCVHEPERRPVLRLHEAGPAMALPTPDAPVAQIEEAAAEDAPVAEIEAPEETADETTVSAKADDNDGRQEAVAA